MDHMSEIQAAAVKLARENPSLAMAEWEWTAEGSAEAQALEAALRQEQPEWFEDDESPSLR